MEIDLFFFSASVDISYERQFAGSNGDPSFADLMEVYLINADDDQVLYLYKNQVYYQLPISGDLYRFDPLTGVSVLLSSQEAADIDLHSPFRPTSPASLKGVTPVDPWRQYCQAFAY